MNPRLQSAIVVSLWGAFPLASLVYTGQVSGDGMLDIIATGNTGQSDYTVGKVAPGTDDAYTTHGKLEGSGGQATRRELRPCTATFSRS